MIKHLLLLSHTESDDEGKGDIPSDGQEHIHNEEVMDVRTVPPPNIGNRVAVGKPRAYRDRDLEKSALGSDAVLPN